MYSQRRQSTRKTGSERNTVRNATVRCETPVRLATLSREAFQDWLATHPEFQGRTP